MQANDQKSHDSLTTPSSPTQVEDLPVEAGKDADVKGGPIYMNYDGVKAAPTRP